jgi:hypothetical protein
MFMVYGFVNEPKFGGEVLVEIRLDEKSKCYTRKVKILKEMG